MRIFIRSGRLNTETYNGRRQSSTSHGERSGTEPSLTALKWTNCNNTLILDPGIMTQAAGRSLTGWVNQAPPPTLFIKESKFLEIFVKSFGHHIKDNGKSSKTCESKVLTFSHFTLRVHPNLCNDWFKSCWFTCGIIWILLNIPHKLSSFQGAEWLSIQQ